MGTMTSEITPHHKEILQNLVNYEYEEFLHLIYRVALRNPKNDLNSELIKQFFIDNEEDFLPLFSKINEDCLNDPAFSKVIMTKELYSKKIETQKEQVLYYPPHSVNSVSNDVYMDLLYIPSPSTEQPNKFRIDVREHLNGHEEYPYIHFSVDIGDDESIIYNQPILVEKDNSLSITKTPANMSMAHTNFNDQGIESLRDMFMYLFEKTKIKENSDKKNK